MIKRMISLTEPQVAYLEAEAKRLGISVPELVRRIVDSYRSNPDTWKTQKPVQSAE